MSYGLPEDWFIEESGERLILDQEKVAAQIRRLRTYDVRRTCFLVLGGFLMGASLTVMVFIKVM